MNVRNKVCWNVAQKIMRFVKTSENIIITGNVVSACAVTITTIELLLDIIVTYYLSARCWILKCLYCLMEGVHNNQDDNNDGGDSNNNQMDIFPSYFKLAQLNCNAIFIKLVQ